MLPTPAGVQGHSEKHGSPAAFPHQYLGWWLCTRAGCLAFLIHTRKLAFEVVWKAPKEMCLMLLVLLPMSRDSAFHQLFTPAACISPAPAARGPAEAGEYHQPLLSVPGWAGNRLSMSPGLTQVSWDRRQTPWTGDWTLFIASPDTAIGNAWKRITGRKFIFFTATSQP